MTSVSHAIAQQPSEQALAQVGWPSENLDENVARQLPPEAIALFLPFLPLGVGRAALVPDLVVKRLMVALDLVAQHDEVHERVGVDDEEDERCQKEERDQRKLDAEEWQLDRLLEEKVSVGDRARGDREIEEHEQVGDPQAPADRGRVVDRLLDRLEVVGLFGDFWQVVRALG